VDHIAVYNYMFRPLSAIVRLYYFCYKVKLHNMQGACYYSNFMIYNSCERDLVTNNRPLAYCVVLLYNRKWYNLTMAERPKHVVVNCYVIPQLIANKYSCV